MLNPSIGKSRKDKTLYLKQKIWRLRVRGWSQTRIGDHLNVTQARISQILKEVSGEYKKRHYEEVDQVKQEQITQLEHIAHEAMRMWEKSKKQHKEKIIVKGGKLAGTTNIERDQCGDPRMLSVFIKAKEDIRKILGLNLKVENPNPGDDDEEEKQVTRYAVPLEKSLDSNELIAVGDVDE